MPLYSLKISVKRLSPLNPLQHSGETVTEQQLSTMQCSEDVNHNYLANLSEYYCFNWSHESCDVTGEKAGNKMQSCVCERLVWKTKVFRREFHSDEVGRSRLLQMPRSPKRRSVWMRLLETRGDNLMNLSVNFIKNFIRTVTCLFKTFLHKLTAMRL